MINIDEESVQKQAEKALASIAGNEEMPINVLIRIFRDLESQKVKNAELIELGLRQQGKIRQIEQVIGLQQELEETYLLTSEGQALTFQHWVRQKAVIREAYLIALRGIYYYASLYDAGNMKPELKEGTEREHYRAALEQIRRYLKENLK